MISFILSDDDDESPNMDDNIKLPKHTPKNSENRSHPKLSMKFVQARRHAVSDRFFLAGKNECSSASNSSDKAGSKGSNLEKFSASIEDVPGERRSLKEIQNNSNPRDYLHNSLQDQSSVKENSKNTSVNLGSGKKSKSPLSIYNKSEKRNGNTLNSRGKKKSKNLELKKKKKDNTFQNSSSSYTLPSHYCLDDVGDKNLKMPSQNSNLSSEEKPNEIPVIVVSDYDDILEKNKNEITCCEDSSDDSFPPLSSFLRHEQKEIDSSAQDLHSDLTNDCAPVILGTENKENGGNNIVTSEAKDISTNCDSDDSFPSLSSLLKQLKSTGKKTIKAELKAFKNTSSVSPRQAVGKNNVKFTNQPETCEGGACGRKLKGGLSVKIKLSFSNDDSFHSEIIGSGKKHVKTKINSNGSLHDSKILSSTPKGARKVLSLTPAQKNKLKSIFDSDDDDSYEIPLHKRIASPFHKKHTPSTPISKVSDNDKIKSSVGKKYLPSTSVAKTPNKVWTNILDCVSAEESSLSSDDSVFECDSGDDIKVSDGSPRKPKLLVPAISNATEKNRGLIRSMPSYCLSPAWKKNATSSNEKGNYRAERKHVFTKSVSTVREAKQASFFASLSDTVPRTEANAEARVFRDQFKSRKDELVKKLFELFNSQVFDNKLPQNMSITWNARMTKTAGFCYSSRDKQRPGLRTARIELSVKVNDCPQRVRDTLIHEMCHAASWIINEYRGGHGSFWRYWAVKANRQIPDLPLIKRCHTYKINTKYTYRCTGCGGCIGRHSKSINVEQQVCSRCRGTFELIVNGKQSSGSASRTPSKFAMFVKENYRNIKDANKDLKHADVMKVLSAEFAKKAKVSS